ncbi:hypothetical protein ACFQH5_15685 [Halomonas salifodinae]|uniref:Uncharacterized protein n=1 Tax=Halomonas salifodinae TaxID=438745 RepID=A0ABW2EYF4_9GAMM
MPSVVDICNRALSHTGTDQTIASLEEKSKEARLCARWYEAARDQLLRTFPWNFAQRRVALATLGDAPVGWDYQYRYPTDCLDMQNVYVEGNWFPGRKGNDLNREPWTVSSTGDGGRVILTNMEQARATYTAKVTDPNLFPPDFVTALEFALAANISMPLVNDPELSNWLYQRARGALDDAMAGNLGEAHDPDHPEAPWTLDRIGGE